MVAIPFKFLTKMFCLIYNDNAHYYHINRDMNKKIKGDTTNNNISISTSTNCQQSYKINAEFSQYNYIKYGIVKTSGKRKMNIKRKTNHQQIIT
jgi:hypothetical protein